MTKAIVVLALGLVAVAITGVITVSRLDDAIDELESMAAQRSAEQAELADAVERMTGLMRRVMTINAMRGDEEQEIVADDRRSPGDAPAGGLEEQVDELDAMIRPYREVLDQALRRQERRAAAQEQAEEDRERYSAEERAEIRQLYRGGRGRRDDEERRANLEKLVEKYPESSVAGCATLRLARGAPNDQPESYYRKAIEQYGDSFCYGGMQVGALARERLAAHYEESGEAERAEQLRAELERDYPYWADHGFRY